MTTTEPIPFDEFEDALERLDDAELAAFVGELYRERAEAVDVEGPLVTVEREAGVRRILASTEASPADTDLDDADAVVAADAGAVPDADVETVGPADLRDQLLYGCPPDRADELAERFLGTSARSAGPGGEVPPDGSPEEDPGGADGSGTSRSTRTVEEDAGATDAAARASGDVAETGAVGDTPDGPVPVTDRQSGTADRSGAPAAGGVGSGGGDRTSGEVAARDRSGDWLADRPAGAAAAEGDDPTGSAGGLLGSGPGESESEVAGSGSRAAALVVVAILLVAGGGAAALVAGPSVGGGSDGPGTGAAGPTASPTATTAATYTEAVATTTTPSPTWTPETDGAGYESPNGSDRYANPEPNCERSFLLVVQIQMNALRYNDPETNDGIRTVRRFASPENRAAVSYDDLVRIVNSPPYDAMLDYDSAEYRPERLGDEEATVEVITRKGGNVTGRFEFELSRQDESGQYDGCWLTDGVVGSTPAED